MDTLQHELIQNVCKRPGMYTCEGSLDNVLAFLDGLDTATACLTGFREWLLPRFNSGNDLAWTGLVKLLLESEHVEGKNTSAHLGELLNEFYLFTREDNGSRQCLLRVYLRYHAWLLNKSWYRPDLPGYIAPYDGVSIPKSDREESGCEE